MGKFGDVNTQRLTSGGGTTILTGSGPPAESAGATGDMYLDTTNKILYGPKTAAAVGSGAGYAQSTGFWSSVGGTGGGFQAGNQYHIVNAMRVTSLRYLTPPDLLTTRQMGIWDIAGNLLSPIVSTPTESGGGWKEVALLPPVDLAAGADIRVAATSSGSIYYSTPPPPMQNSSVTITVGMAQSNASGVVVFPTSNWGYYFPTDIGIGSTWTEYTLPTSGWTPASVGSLYTLGLRYHVTSTLKVVALRFLRATGDTVTSRTLGIWRNDGTLLSSVTTSGETGSTWISVPLPTPVNLAANDDIRVAFTASNLLHYMVGGAPTSVAAGVTVTGGALGVGGPTFPGINHPDSYPADFGIERGGGTKWLTKIKSA